MIYDILNSDKIHLTTSQKNFIKETYELLSIFKKDVYKIFKEKLNRAISSSDNKFKSGEIFFKQIYELRYPITSTKLKLLKKFKIHSLEISTKEIKSLNNKNIADIKDILTRL